MKTLVLLTTISLAASAHAATWQYNLPAGATAEITPLKYGKSWAYAVEIDDNPTGTLTVVQPLLAKYQWNDAPPGVPGGTNRPFVGTAAVTFSGINGGNSTRLNLEQIEQLKKSGWSIVNHSYWHTGNHWDKSKFLKPEEFRRELYWSQAMFAALVGDGRAATHFVYPNGDFHFGPYLTEFGLRSASRVSGSSPMNLADPKLNFLDWPRNYLDEEPWKAKNDALHGLPKPPKALDFVTDFTHGINANPDSDNQKRWAERLNHIASTYGAAGDNSMWVAPTDEVINYSLAAKAARVNVANGKLTVDVPDTTPGSAVTVKISGLPAGANLTAPEGGTLIRQGANAWLTTPFIGKAGVEPPTPKLRKVYSGEVKDVTFDQPIALAGVRFRQSGPVATGFKLKLDITKPDGTTASILPGGEATVSNSWGTWLLYPTIPDAEAPQAKELRVTPDKNLREMEVWALAP